MATEIVEKTRPYTFQTSYEFHGEWKLADGVELPKPLEEALAVSVEWDNLIVLWEGLAPLSFDLHEVGGFETTDTKHPINLVIWTGEVYDSINTIYDDEVDERPQTSLKQLTEEIENKGEK